MEKKQYQLIVFDWDGTIVDSAASIVSCMQQVMQRMQLTPRDEDDIKHIIGLGMRQAILALYPSFSEAQIQSFIEIYREHFFTMQQSPAFPGVDELLSRLHGEGYSLAVATGKGRHGLDLALQRLDFGRYFHATRCADETQSKPHPQMLQELLQELELSPDQALMVGDTSYDLDMAKNIRMDAVAVCNGAHDREKLNACMPLAFLPQVTHLWEWLNG